MEEINQRLAIFLQSGIISEEDAEFLKEWNERLIEEGYDDRDKICRLLTHLVMMLKRKRDNEMIESMSYHLADELKGSANYNEACCYLKLFEDRYEIEENERNYIILHLLNLMR